MTVCVSDHRRDGRPVHDWSDLLQPRLKARIAFAESPRELVGVALPTLGLSYYSRLDDFNDAGVTQEQLEERLRALHRQVSSAVLAAVAMAVPIWANEVLLLPLCTIDRPRRVA